MKQWRAAGSFFDAAEQAAAIHQDVVCRAMRAAMTKAGLTGEELSERLGKNRAHVGRKLRGEDWLAWRELHEWALATGDRELVTAVLDAEVDVFAGPTTPAGAPFQLP